MSLAVRVNPLPGVLASEPADDVERDEDNASIDGYVSGFGFEYVDATLDVDDPQERSGYQEEDESDGELSDILLLPGPLKHPTLIQIHYHRDTKSPSCS